MARFVCTSGGYANDGELWPGDYPWTGSWAHSYESAWFRVDSLAWDPAAPITEAYLVAVCTGNDIDHDGAVVNLLIEGDKEVLPADIAGSSGDPDTDYFARARTTVNVVWNVGTPPNDGDTIVTPNLAAVLSELVGQVGWVSGHPVQLFVEEHGSDEFTDFDWPHIAQVSLFINEEPPSPPTITSFTPTSAQTGASVVITGTGFSSADRVLFDGVDAASFTVDSDTQITAVIPTLTISGPIVVHNAVGSVTSATSLTIPPSVTLVARADDLADGAFPGNVTPCLVQLNDSVVLVLYGGTTVEADVGSPSTGTTPFYEGRVRALSIPDLTRGPSAHLDAAPTSSSGGNILSADDATFASSVGHWIDSGGNASLSRVTSPAPHAGTGVLKVTHSTPPFSFEVDAVPFLPNFYHPPAGSLVTLTMWVRSDPANTFPGAWVRPRLNTNGTETRVGELQPVSYAWTEISITNFCDGFLIVENQDGQDGATTQALGSGNAMYFSDVSVSWTTGPLGVVGLAGCRLDDDHALVVYRDGAGTVWAVVVTCADPSVAPTVGVRVAVGASFVSGNAVGAEVMPLSPTAAAVHLADGKYAVVVTDGSDGIASVAVNGRGYVYPGTTAAGYYRALPLSTDDSTFAASVGHWISGVPNVTLTAKSDVGGPYLEAKVVAGGVVTLQAELPATTYAADALHTYGAYCAVTVTAGTTANQDLEVDLVDDTGTASLVGNASGSLILNNRYIFGPGNVRLYSGATKVGVKVSLHNADGSALPNGTTVQIRLVAIVEQLSNFIPTAVVDLGVGEYALVENYTTPDGFAAHSQIVPVGHSGSPPTLTFGPPTDVAAGGGQFNGPSNHADGWALGSGAFRVPLGDSASLYSGHDGAGISVTGHADTPGLGGFIDPTPLVASLDGGAGQFLVVTALGGDPVARTETLDPTGAIVAPNDFGRLPNIELLGYHSERLVLSLDGQALMLGSYPGTGQLSALLLGGPPVPPAPPTITGITPVDGAPGTIVTVSGTGLFGATDVSVGGRSGPFKVLSGTQIVTSAAASGVVTVTTPAGSATSGRGFRLDTAAWAAGGVNFENGSGAIFFGDPERAAIAARPLVGSWGGPGPNPMLSADPLTPPGGAVSGLVHAFGRWVAVGQKTTRGVPSGTVAPAQDRPFPIATSFDLVDWTPASCTIPPNEQNITLNSVCDTGRELIAVGDPAFYGSGPWPDGHPYGVFRSTDGQLWAPIVTPYDLLFPGANGNFEFVASDRDGTIVMSASYQGGHPTRPLVLRSIDGGFNWIPETLPDVGVASGGPVFFTGIEWLFGVATGRPGVPALITSLDGAGWTARHTAMDGASSFTGFATDGSTVVAAAVTATALLYAMTDGVNWAPLALATAPAFAVVFAVAYAYGRWIVVGQADGGGFGYLPVVAESTDLVTWTAVELHSSASCLGVRTDLAPRARHARVSSGRLYRV